MNEHTADSDPGLRQVLLDALMSEYGGTVEDWTALGSLTRVTKAIRGHAASSVVGATDA